MMHGSVWTLKYDELEVENVARGRIFSLGFIIFQCRTNDRAPYVSSYGQPLACYLFTLVMLM